MKKRLVSLLLNEAKAATKLGKAIERADKRGYTGFVHSKGGLFDDPKVKAAARAYDRALNAKAGR
jgi:hypothetical protein